MTHTCSLFLVDPSSRSLARVSYRTCSDIPLMHDEYSRSGYLHCSRTADYMQVFGGRHNMDVLRGVLTILRKYTSFVKTTRKRLEVQPQLLWLQGAILPGMDRGEESSSLTLNATLYNTMMGYRSCSPICTG